MWTNCLFCFDSRCSQTDILIARSIVWSVHVSRFDLLDGSRVTNQYAEKALAQGATAIMMTASASCLRILSRWCCVVPKRFGRANCAGMPISELVRRYRISRRRLTSTSSRSKLKQMNLPTY
jgi:hypothetical protein